MSLKCPYGFRITAMSASGWPWLLHASFAWGILCLDSLVQLSPLIESSVENSSFADTSVISRTSIIDDPSCKRSRIQRMCLHSARSVLRVPHSSAEQLLLILLDQESCQVHPWFIVLFIYIGLALNTALVWHCPVNLAFYLCFTVLAFFMASSHSKLIEVLWCRMRCNWML